MTTRFAEVAFAVVAATCRKVVTCVFDRVDPGCDCVLLLVANAQRASTICDVLNDISELLFSHNTRTLIDIYIINAIAIPGICLQ